MIINRVVEHFPKKYVTKYNGKMVAVPIGEELLNGYFATKIFLKLIYESLHIIHYIATSSNALSKMG